MNEIFKTVSFTGHHGSHVQELSSDTRHLNVAQVITSNRVVRETQGIRQTQHRQGQADETMVKEKTRRFHSIGRNDEQKEHRQQIDGQTRQSHSVQQIRLRLTRVRSRRSRRTGE